MRSERPPRLPRERDDDGLPPVDLRVLLRRLSQGWWILLACALGGLASGLLLISRTEPTYTASSQILLLVDEADGEEAEGDRVLDAQRLATEIEIIHSAAVLGAAADDLGLADDPAFVEALRDRGSTLDRLATGLRDALPEQTLQVWERLGAPSGPSAVRGAARVPEPTPQMLVIEHLGNHLRLQQIADSRVIDLAYTAEDAVDAARTANAVTDAYIADRVAARQGARERRLRWLRDRVEELGAEVREAEDAVETRRAELLAETGEGLDITRRQLEARAQELAQARSETARLALLHERLTEALGAGEAGLLTAEFRNAEPVAALLTEERELRERVRNLAPDGPSQPLLEAQIEATRARIRAETERIAAGVGEDLRAARETDARLTAAVREVEDQMLDQSRAELDLQRLELSAGLERSNYEEVSRQLLRAAGRPELTQADIRVLSRAVPPQAPDNQREKLILLLTLITGALVGVGLVVLRDQTNNAFRGARELEAATGVPVLASLPRIRARRGRDVVAYYVRRPHSSLAEAVRGLCAELVPDGGAPARVVMLTAPLIEDGKSTAAALAAIGFRRLGRRVILVDCDIRRPRIPELLGEAPTKVGLQSVIAGRDALDEAIARAGPHGIDTLPAGVAEDADGNTDALYSAEFQETIQALRRRYDVVVLDAPPVLVTADARIIARAADAVLLLVAWNRTSQASVSEAIDALSSAGTLLRGTVLHAVDERRAEAPAFGGHQRQRARRMGYVNN